MSVYIHISFLYIRFSNTRLWLLLHKEPQYSTLSLNHTNVDECIAYYLPLFLIYVLSRLQISFSEKTSKKSIETTSKGFFACEMVYNSKSADEAPWTVTSRKCGRQRGRRDRHRIQTHSRTWARVPECINAKRWLRCNKRKAWPLRNVKQEETKSTWRDSIRAVPRE